jgi:hypothetical protein
VDLAVKISPPSVAELIAGFAENARAALELHGHPFTSSPRSITVQIRKVRIQKNGKWSFRCGKVWASASHQWRGGRSLITLAVGTTLNKSWLGDLRHECMHAIMWANGIPQKRQHEVMKALTGGWF